MKVGSGFGVLSGFLGLALRTLTFLGFCMNYTKEAKSLTFRRGSEVSQGFLTGKSKTSKLFTD